MKAPARRVWWLALSLMLIGILLSGCALGRNSAGDQYSSKGGERQSPFSAGVWQGTSVSDCTGMAPCRGLKQITFTMLPSRSGGLGGFYRCAQITAACDNYNDRGLITNASVNHRLLSVNVELPDDQSCIFRSVARPVEMEGRFFCKQRAVLIDRGVWRAERSF
ncbi:MAG TPA: hypothetical protein VHY56_08695 [Candidatus Binataceae bacterium]|nr:hypothetical protein [Candidatus Binataceae bacterium]